MGSRSHAVLWYGAKSTQYCPINPDSDVEIEYDDNDKPINEPEAMEYDEQEAHEKALKKLGAEVVTFYSEGDEKYALAVKGSIHDTDWDDDLKLGTTLKAPPPEKIEAMRAAAKELGWGDVGPLAWRMGSYWF